jgi:outer membrane protein
MRLGYVDLQRALTESRVGKKAQKEYETAVKKAQGDLDIKKSEFEKLRESFTKQRESLNADALQKKEEELMEKERDIKRSFKDSQERLRRTNAQMVGDLMKDLRVAVEAVGKSKSLTVILEKGSQAVLYASDEIDVTDEVVEKFNAQSK